MKCLPKEQNLLTMLNQAGDRVDIYNNLQQSQILVKLFSNDNTCIYFGCLGQYQSECTVALSNALQ